MQNDIQGERQSKFFHPPRHLEFVFEDASAGNSMRFLGAETLERQLDAIEAAIPKSFQSLALERSTAGNEIRIQTQSIRFRNEFLKVVSQQGLAPGHVHLDDSQVFGFSQRSPP